MKKSLTAAVVLLSFLMRAAFGQPVLPDDTDRYQLPAEKIDVMRAANTLRGDKVIAAEREQAFEAQINMLDKRRAEVLKWTGVQFEVGERHIVDKPRAMTKLMASWQRQRDLELYQLVQFGERSGGNIESGRALNALLESLGAAALQNSEVRRLKPEAALPLTAPAAIIEVNRALFDEIKWKDNTLGAAGVGQGNRGPLEGLDWPPILREERWKPYRDHIDDARSRATADIKSSGFITEKTDVDFRGAVNELNKDFAEFRSKWCSNNQAAGNRSLEWQRLCGGRDHIRELVTAAYHAAELTPAQVSYRETFNGGSIEDFIAFFRRNNLSVEPAAPAHRSAYHKLFNMMVRYYLDERLAVNLERELDKELGTLKENRQEAIDAALRRTTTPSHETAVQIMGLDSLPRLLK